MKLDPALVKNSLSAHSWLGLLVGAMMYVTCLSGALLVFHAELKQWEQPDSPEFTQLDSNGLEDNFNAYIDRGEGVTPYLSLVFPSPDSPRARLTTGSLSWFLNSDGSPAQAEDSRWSKMLLKLHLYLHLPSAWGMLLVSALGAVLVGLIMSGFFAHPKLFRDAFNLRLGGSKQLEQTDIHNRLSVWGAPFYLVIALTGAYFGLATPLMNLYAQAEHNGDTGSVASMIFGEGPSLNHPVGRIEIAKALAKLAEIAPDAEPLMLVLHDAGETKQHLSISAFHPGRLTYAEIYLFDTQGNFISSNGYIDGPVGKQVLYSIYRLHFGTFAGALTKWVYVLLGLALTVVSSTGINVWLARRRQQDQLNNLWVGLVWGIPLGITLSAALKISTSIPPIATLWSVVVLACIFCTLGKNLERSRQILRTSLALAIIGTVALHVFLYREFALAGMAVVINGVLLCTAVTALVAQYWLIPHSLKHLD